MSDPDTGMKLGSTITEEIPAAPQATGSKPKKSNTLLNVLLIILGLIFFARGVFDFLTWLNLIPFPAWLQTLSDKLSGPEANSALSFLGPQAVISATLGFWAIVSGILLFAEKETGWSMALVIMSTISLMGISMVISWITTPETFDARYWPNYFSLFTTIAGIIGFITLLITRKRYR